MGTWSTTAPESGISWTPSGGAKSDTIQSQYIYKTLVEVPGEKPYYEYHYCYFSCYFVGWIGRLKDGRVCQRFDIHHWNSTGVPVGGVKMDILPIAIDKVNNELVSIKCNISTWTDFPDGEQIIYRYYVADNVLIGVSSITIGLDADHNPSAGIAAQKRISKSIDVPQGGHILYYYIDGEWRKCKIYYNNSNSWKEGFIYNVEHLPS